MSTLVLRPLSLGEVLDASLAVYRRLFVQLLGVSFATQAIPLALGAYIEGAGGVLVHPAFWMVQTVFAIVAGALGTATSTFIVSEYYLGRTTPTVAALGRATGYLGRLILLTIATGLVVGIGVVFLVVPGIILFAGLVLSTPALVIEDIPVATAAMRRSWFLTRGFKGKIFGAYALAFLLLLVPTIAITWIAAMTGAGGIAANPSAGALGLQVIASLLQILIYPFIYVLATLLYYDMRVRKEGFDLEMLASTLQPA